MSIESFCSLDWGKVSDDYASFRPPPPLSFFQKLLEYDIGLEKQNILDLGTGVGFLAIQFARQKASVVGIDISANQIEVAKKLAQEAALKIDYLVSPAEEIVFQESRFDVATAMQCWPYFDRNRLYPRLKRILKPGGVVMVGNYDQLPHRDPIAHLTENLMLQYNPKWNQAGWSGEIDPIPDWFSEELRIKGMFFYDEAIPFTTEGWIGRIIASQAIGTVLSADRVFEFKERLRAILKRHVDEQFTVLHRLSAHVFEFRKSTEI